jgi:hypothetical protein
LEPNAALGHMIEDMPGGARLYRCGKSVWAYQEPRPSWGNVSSCERHGDTAAEAIEAVRSKS